MSGEATLLVSEENLFVQTAPSNWPDSKYGNCVGSAARCTSLRRTGGARAGVAGGVNRITLTLYTTLNRSGTVIACQSRAISSEVSICIVSVNSSFTAFGMPGKVTGMVMMGF